MDETIKHKIKQQYNRLSALLVFIANAFTLMYVGGMAYNDALWFGSVSGAFTYTILSTIADSQDLEDLIPEKRKPASYQVPTQPIPQNMIPYQQYQQMQQQPPQPMAPMPAGGYINPQSGELLDAEQGPHIDKIAGKKSG